MQKKRPRTLVIFIALAAFAAQAQALGFGSGPAGAVLGQSLDQVIGVRLDPGEQLGSECVSAEVQVGETRLPATAVRTRLEGEGQNLVVRVQTTSVIDEPVVTVALALGCPARLSRRFVVFADPASAAAPSAPVSPPATVSVDDQQSAPEQKTSPPVPLAEARPAARPPVAASNAQVAVAKPVQRPPRPPAKRVPRVDEPSAPVAAARPRLKLDAVEAPVNPALTAELIQAAASAAAAQAAAQATAEANAAAASRVAALEQSIERLRADSAADRETLKALRQKAAQDSQWSGLASVLLALLVALAALAAWLGLRLRRLQAERQQAWWNAAGSPNAAAAAAVAAAGAAPTGANTDAGTLSPSAGPQTGAAMGYSSTRPGTLGPVFKPDLTDEPTTQPPLSVIERTEPLPVGWREDPEPQRDVSIEELIDLEQQAEFFIVLGQEEAAIDLLVDHLRSTGGGSPLPYLKLLEIYRRRGDREAYDRTRARFNHRFNAYAPDWDDDTQTGRALEDYPSIVARLQMAWPSPIDAMAELESLLFRKARGELFDMPAYRDVLFLYSLARDLLDREPQGAPNVDVLLPINEGVEFTQPMSFDDLVRPGDSGMVPLDNPPTVPVDLDVTQPSMPDSLFPENVNDPGVVGGRRRR
jgi:pilus assembly protein FimV